MKSEPTINQIKWVNLLVLYLCSSHFPLHFYIQQPQGQTKPSNADLHTPSPTWGLALGHQQLLIFALRSEKPEPEPLPSTTKSIPSPALDALPYLITFAPAPTIPDLNCPSPQVWLHSLRHTSRFPSPDPPSSSISFSLAKFIAQPNPNKVLASVKQGALHKKVMSASNADRRDSVLWAFERVLVRACLDVWMLYMCVTLTQSPSTDSFQWASKAGFEVISWEPLAKATAPLEEEWHHGIQKGDSIQQARFWMTETVNDCLQAVWSQAAHVVLLNWLLSNYQDLLDFNLSNLE